MQRKPLVIFGGLFLLGLVICATYVIVADQFCPVGEPQKLELPFVHLTSGDSKNEKTKWGQRSEQRGTHYQNCSTSIIPAVLQPAAPTDEREGREAQKDDKSHRWAVKFFCEAKAADVALVFFTWCLVIATLWLGWATIGLWTATEQTIRLATSEYTSTHRPRLSVRQIRLVALSVGLPVQINYRVVNSGETAANIHEINGTILITNGEIPPIPEYDESKTFRQVPVQGKGLHSGQWISCSTTTAWDVNDVVVQTFHTNFVALVGYVRYSDDAGIVRQMAFGRRYRNEHFERIQSEEYEYQD